MNKITNYNMSRRFSADVHNYIPGGAHTYTKGDDHFHKFT